MGWRENQNDVGVLFTLLVPIHDAIEFSGLVIDVNTLERLATQLEGIVPDLLEPSGIGGSEKVPIWLNW